MSYDKEFLEWMLSGWAIDEKTQFRKILPEEEPEEEVLNYKELEDLRLEREYDKLMELALYWMNIRNKDIRTFDKYELEIVRKLLEAELNPKGGYIQRDFSHLKYYALMSIILPNGVVLNESETDRAWRGQSASREFPYILNLDKLGFYKEVKNPNSLFGRYGVYDKEKFYHKYVIVNNLYWNYSDQIVDKFISGAINDMYYFRIGYDVKREHFYNFYSKHGNKLFSVSDEFTTVKFFNLGMFVSEIRYFLSWLKEIMSTGVYPLFLNYGFYRTMSNVPIEVNWGLIREIIDGYFNEKGVEVNEPTV